jgi:hypothetical protein
LAIGGESSGMALGNVECLTSGYDSWKCIVPTFVVQGEPCEETRVIPTMHHPRFYAAVTAKDYEVFVIGEYVCETDIGFINLFSSFAKSVRSVVKRQP